MLGVVVETKDFNKAIKKFKAEVYRYPFESTLEFLFADEFGFIDSDKTISKSEIKKLFEQYFEPMLQNF